MLDNVIGQNELKKSIKVAIGAAQYRKEVLGHILLSGAGGLGKTHLLRSICSEVGYHLSITQGSRLTPVKVAQFIKNSVETADALGKVSFMCIDEIHEMSDDAQEELYYPLDHHQILTLGDPIQLSPFTLVGATTEPEGLDGKSLINRFKHFWKMEEMTCISLMIVVNLFFIDNGIACSSDDIETIANRSKGIPRLALKYASKVRDYAQYNRRNNVQSSDIDKAFVELGVDDFGLDKNQQKYLTILHRSDKPIGLDCLANMLGEMSVSQVKKMIEPFLYKAGFISSSSRGRQLTRDGCDHIASGYLI